MIPKIIHYLWLSKNKPDNIISCLDTWKDHLKDYKIIEWNDETFPYNDFLWTKEAFSVQKWAFVTDFFRLWVLKKYGGIYLDADMVVRSNFDAFLNNKLFIGAEFAHQLGPHAIGAEPEHPFISRCLEYYDNRHFITGSKYCETPLPIIITKIFIKHYNYSGKIINFNDEPVYFDDMVIYNDTFFTVNTYNGKNICYHNYLASWVEGGQKFTLSDATSSYFLKKYFCFDIFKRKNISKIFMLFLPLFITTLVLKYRLSIKNHWVIKKVNINNLKKKIIIVSLNGDDNSGGVERVVYYLNIILREKYTVSILYRKGKKYKLDKLIFPLLFSLRLLFKKNAVVISNSWQSFLYSADYSIHHGTTEGYMRHSGIRSKKSALLAWMEKVSARRAKNIIAVSENCKRELEALYSIEPKKIVVLNNFVDERLFYPDTEEKSGKIRILFSGRLEERKGLSRLHELAKTIESRDKYQLKIAVNSSDNCALFADFKNTVILSHLDINKMREFYNSGDVLYFPTKYEGFSMATLEALACGIPVVGTSFAIPEELRRYDFVRVEESADIEKVLVVIEEMKQRFGPMGPEIHQQITRDFGYEQYRQKLLEIIDKNVS